MTRALVACERSGRVRNALRAHGLDAYSCDLQPAEDGSPYHLVADALTLLDDGWDLLVAHPPCTFLCGSGLFRNQGNPARQQRTVEALDFVRVLLAAKVRHIAVENPIGCIGTAIRPPDQIIQPYQFGHDASKRTALWLVNLPALRHTGYIAPRFVGGRPRWANQTDSGQNRLPPSPTRAADRGRTYLGIADAMGAQWAPWVRRKAGTPWNALAS